MHHWTAAFADGAVAVLSERRETNNEEVVQQNALLGLFEEDVQRVDGKIRIAKKRIEKIR